VTHLPPCIPCPNYHNTPQPLARVSPCSSTFYIRPFQPVSLLPHAWKRSLPPINTSQIPGRSTASLFCTGTATPSPGQFQQSWDVPGSSVVGLPGCGAAMSSTADHVAARDKVPQMLQSQQIPPRVLIQHLPARRLRRLLNSPARGNSLCLRHLLLQQTLPAIKPSSSQEMNAEQGPSFNPQFPCSRTPHKATGINNTCSLDMNQMWPNSQKKLLKPRN